MRHLPSHWALQRPPRFLLMPLCPVKLHFHSLRRRLPRYRPCPMLVHRPKNNQQKRPRWRKQGEGSERSYFVGLPC